MDSRLLYALSAIYLLLIIASVILTRLRMKHPEKNWQELILRTRTWWGIVFVFSLAMISPKAVSLTIFGFISFIALKEYLTLIPTRQTDYMTLLWAYIAIPIQYYWVSLGWYGMFSVFIPVYVFLFLPMRTVFVGNNQGFLCSTSVLHWGVMTTVFSLSHVAYLMVLPDMNLTEGALLVVFLVLLTESNDIAQYLWGKKLGKTKVIPKVSPNKTLEGLVGGVFTTTMLAGVLGGLLTPLNFTLSLLAGSLIGLSGFVGDIVMSAVKRDIGVKDSGSFLPGHGGILDRLDSLIYTAPLFFHFVHYFCY